MSSGSGNSSTLLSVNRSITFQNTQLSLDRRFRFSQFLMKFYPVESFSCC